MSELTVKDIWERYEKIREEHLFCDLEEKAKACLRFYEGDQWYGVEKPGERLPKYNFIRPTVDYKLNIVAKNNMSISYSSAETSDKLKNEICEHICENFNNFAKRKWNRSKMDFNLWQCVKNGCITGDSYIFFFNENIDSQILPKENIYFSDERESDIQKQKYIIVFERRNVEDVRREARKKGISKADISLIVPDDEDRSGENFRTGNDSLCTSLLYLYKKDGCVHFIKATKNLIYSRDEKIENMRLYPIASFIWQKKHNSARGIGEVYEMIPNQISANALLVRREINNKMTGYAKPVFNSDYIENPESITKIGTAIKVSGPAVENVSDVFGYVAPSPMSAEAKQLQEEIVNLTQQLHGAYNLMIGQIDPQKASGLAIVAAQEQAVIPLGESSAAFQRLIEDISNIWLDMWICYHPDGMSLEYEKDGTDISYVVPQRILRKMQFNIRVDISPVNPFSKYAREQSLEGALTKNYISFEEFVSALDEGSSVPKGKFDDIIRRRRRREAVEAKEEKGGEKGENNEEERESN